MTVSIDKMVNKYSITCLLFLIWVCFLDSKYSWVKQYKLTRQLNKMEKDERQYIEKLESAKIVYSDLMENKEKFAREKYFIGKEGEDVFIINEKQLENRNERISK